MLRKLTARLAALGLIAAVTASTAVAQPWRGRGGGEDVFDPAVTTDQMERYAAILDLSADQKAAAQALLEAYHVEFAGAAQPVRQRIENLRTEARETRDRTLWGEIMEARQAFEDEGEAMEERFLTNVQTLLTPEQAEQKWPVVVRDRRREASMARGVMSGERVDVIALVKDLELAEEQAAGLQDTLRQYELELDLALVKRNRVQDEFADNMREMFRSGDRDGLADMFDRGKQASTKVRDINRQYARQIEAQLPPDAAATFAEEVRRRSFPMIYHESFAERVLSTAEKFDDLTAEQKENLGTIRASFNKDFTSLSRQMETAQVRVEESMTAERMPEMWRGGGDDSEMRDLRRQRRDMESATVDRVRSILTEEQAARLPERGQRGDGDEDDRRGFRGRRGGGDRDGGDAPERGRRGGT